MRPVYRSFTRRSGRISSQLRPWMSIRGYSNRRGANTFGKRIYARRQFVSRPRSTTRYVSRARPGYGRYFRRSFGFRRRVGFRRGTRMSRGSFRRYSRFYTRRHPFKRGHSFRRRGGFKRVSSPYYSYAPKVSNAFRNKVQQALNYPYKYTFTTANIAVIPNLATTEYPCRWFQPHKIADVGTPAAAPTSLTQIPFYLFDYPTTAAIFNSVFTNNEETTQRQYLTVSGFVEYTLRNQSSEDVLYEVYIWKIRKPVPRIMMGIPGTTTNPVPTGNLLNLLGQSIAIDLDQDFPNPDGINNALFKGEITLPMLQMFNDYVHTRKYKFRLRPGHFKKFTLQQRRLLLSTADLFNNFENSPSNYGDVQNWANSFVPGAKGILFRMFGSLGKPSSITNPDENSVSQYTLPESSIHTKFTYYAYPGTEQVVGKTTVLMDDSGTQNGAGATRIVNPETATVVDFQTA